MTTIIRNIFSTEVFRAELSIMKLAIPMFVLYIVRTSSASVSIYFAGKLGKEHLDGVGLSNTMYATVAYAFTIGYANVFDTYGPQVYGSRHRKELSTIALKCVAQGTIIYLFVLGPYLNLVYLIDVLPDDIDGVTGSSSSEFKDVAKQYLRMTASCCYLTFLIKIMTNYLAIQKQTKFVYLIAVVGFSSHFVLNYVFISKFSLGTTGLALATIGGLLTTSLFAFTVCFIMIRRGVLVWGGISGRMFDNWLPMIKLGVSGVISLIAEIGLFEGAVFLSQFDSSTVLSTFLIQFRALVFAFSNAVGFSYAGAVRTGKALSQGDLYQVKLNMKLSIFNVITGSTILSIVAYFIRKPMVMLFTDDTDIIDMSCKSMWMFCLLMPIDHLQAVLAGGVLVSFGKQRFIALVIGLTASLVGLPIVALSVFLTDLHIAGIYISYMTFCVLLVVAFVIRIWKLDFDEEIKKAAERVNESSLKIENRLDRRTNGTVNKAYEPEFDETVMKRFKDTFPEEEDREVTRRFSVSKPTYCRARDTKVIILAFFGSIVSCTVFGLISIIHN